MNGLQAGCRATKTGARDRDTAGLATMFYCVVNGEVVASYLTEAEAKACAETINSFECDEATVRAD